MSKDIFDEFEFKPITQGLGFHRNPATPTTDNTPDQFAKLPSFRATSAFYTPEVEPESIKPAQPTAGPTANSTVEAILKTLNEQKKLEIVNEKQTLNSNLSEEKFVRSTWNFSAVLLDAMLIFSMNLICLIVLLSVTKVDLFMNLFNPDEQGLVFVSLFALFASVTWIYMTATRLFLGYTPGEWIFDQRLGKPDQFGKGLFSLKVALRPIVLIATGFFLFPALSALFNRDLLGQIMGLELVKKA